MRTAIYSYVEKNGERKIGLTLAPIVTKWWLRRREEKFCTLLTPPLPLYLALYLYEKGVAWGKEGRAGQQTGKEVKGAGKESDCRDQSEEEMNRVILSSLEVLARSLPHVADLWEKSKGKRFSDRELLFDPHYLRTDAARIAPMIEGRFWMVEHMERALRQQGTRLLGEQRMLGGRKGASKEPWLEGERRVMRRDYLLLLIQLLYHEGKITLTSGMRLVTDGTSKKIKIRCERCHTLYDRWQGHLCGICEQEDMVCETCLTMGASKGCKIVIAASPVSTQGEVAHIQAEPIPPQADEHPQGEAIPSQTRAVSLQSGAVSAQGEAAPPQKESVSSQREMTHLQTEPAPPPIEVAHPQGRTPSEEGPPLLQWEGELTPAQKEASDAAVDFVRGNRFSSAQELLIHAVTGAGKTEVVFQAIQTALRQGGKVLIATPRKEVVIELAPRLQKVFPGVKSISLYGGSRQNGETSDLVIATTHQALNFYRAFQFAIIDEIDAFPFHNHPMLQVAVERALAPNGKKILLTATPTEEILKRVRKGGTARILIPSRHHGHPLPVPILRYESDLEEKIKKNRLPKAADQFIRELLLAKRQAFLFVPRIDLVERLARLIRQSYSVVSDWSEGDSPSPLFGQTHGRKHPKHARETFLPHGSSPEPPDPAGKRTEHDRDDTSFSWVEGVFSGEPKRDEKIAAFRAGKIRLLVTTTILERGVTIPSLDVCVLMADAQLFDAGSLIQISGRVGRSADDPTGKILFLAESRSQACVEAVRGIKWMNHEAERKGYIKPKKQTKSWLRHIFPKG